MRDSNNFLKKVYKTANTIIFSALLSSCISTNYSYSTSINSLIYNNSKEEIYTNIIEIKKGTQEIFFRDEPVQI